MKTKADWTRLLVAVFTVCGLMLAGTPDMVSAQAPGVQGNNGHGNHKWKHDKIKPPGPPCPKADRPCPPGLGSGGNNPGNGNPSGGNGRHNALVEVGVVFTPGFEPTETMTGALTALREAQFQTPTRTSTTAQQVVFDVFRTEGDVSDSGLVKALTSKGNETAQTESVALATAIRNLTALDGQLPATVEAFNVFVDASSEAFLADPSPEFVVVHSFIGTLVEEAMAATEGSR